MFRANLILRDNVGLLACHIDGKNFSPFVPRNHILPRGFQRGRWLSKIETSFSQRQIDGFLDQRKFVPSALRLPRNDNEP